MTAMYFQFAQPARDPLWGLMDAFAADPRAHKLDLGVGVYRDESGATPVLRAVREAEMRLADAAPSKTYRSLSGNAAFNAGITRLLLGQDGEAVARTLTLQTVGGTGALRMLAELIAAARPGATVWLSNPGYVNHRPIMEAAGLAVAEYPWKAVDGVFSVAAMRAGLRLAAPGDVLLVQGCCHNPTGIDPSFQNWQTIADLCRERELVPLVDMAYQGLGAGLDEDAAGLRLLVAQLDTVLVASSCSKNMGLYCERTGAASVVVREASSLQAISAVMQGIARRDYSMPPEHGAAIAAALMAEPAAWHDELGAMRARIREVRRALEGELRRLEAPAGMLAVSRQQGMFSMLPFDAGTMTRLREEFAVYGTAEGRVNLAGLTTGRVRQFAEALMSVVEATASAIG